MVSMSVNRVDAVKRILFQVPGVVNIYPKEPTSVRPLKHVDAPGDPNNEDSAQMFEETDSSGAESCYFSGSGTPSQHSNREDMLDEEDAATLGGSGSSLRNKADPATLVRPETSCLHVPRGSLLPDLDEGTALCSARSLSGVGLTEVQCDENRPPSSLQPQSNPPRLVPKPPIQILPAVTLTIEPALLPPKETTKIPSSNQTFAPLLVPPLSSSSTLPPPARNRRKSSISTLAIDKIKSIFNRGSVDPDADGSSGRRHDSVTTITGDLSRRDSLLSYSFRSNVEDGDDSKKQSSLWQNFLDFLLCKTKGEQAVPLHHNRFAQVITVLVLFAFLGIVIAIIVKTSV